MMSRFSISYNFPFLKDIIFLFTGLGCVVAGVKKKQQREILQRSGIRTEGIVVGLEESDSTEPDSLMYPVIRFVTLEKEWVTEKYSSASKPGYREGDKVNVLYNPEDTKSFIIDDKLSKYSAIILIAIGICIILYLIVGIFI